MPIPDYQALMLPVLRAAARGETRVPEVADTLADELGLSQEERDQLLPSGRQRLLHNRIHWAKFYMHKAGLIDQPRRGQFVASNSGRALLEQHPLKIDVNTLLTYPAFKEFYENGSAGGSTAGGAGGVMDGAMITRRAQSEATDSTPEERIEAAYSTLHLALRAELLERILQNSPSFFEQVIVNLLVAMGYGGSHANAAMQLGRTGDGGVDGVINEDRLGLDRVYIQAKRYETTSVGRPDVQAFLGSLVGLGATKGVFVTTSTFSQQAIEFAKHLPQRVILIDGQRLTELMIEHNVGVRKNRSVELKRVDEDFFSEEE
ncbi:MAG: restriction endonuclease [Alphaproteobacteria bacterium]